jgi:putative endonuclease
MRPAFVYFLRCADGSIYTGWAYDVARRVRVHQQGRGARYTRSRRPVKLFYSEQLPSRRDAMRREAAIKSWTRDRKLALAKKNKSTKNTKSAKNK